MESAILCRLNSVRAPSRLMMFQMVMGVAVMVGGIIDAPRQGEDKKIVVGERRVQYHNLYISLMDNIIQIWITNI